METDKKLQGVHHSMFPPLNGEHGEVIALLGIAHEVGHGLHHTLDERRGSFEAVCTTSKIRFLPNSWRSTSSASSSPSV